MQYMSVCSGIEAATVAWHPLGWQPVGFSEIEKFPSALLAHHYPEVPNLGDMTKYKEWKNVKKFELLVGGTPCQSFSIAGLRKGLDDPRGNLMLTYLGIADHFKPKWVVWENVPGVLSSNQGRDFGTFLGALGKLGYGFAYRVLDAQFCRTHEHPRAVPQRRRRVFVVGCLGDWRRAAAVLFDTESLCGNPPPLRSKGQETAPTITRGFGDRGYDVDQIAGGGYAITYDDVSKCLTRGVGQRYNPTDETFALAGNTIGRQPNNGGNGIGYDDTGSSYTLTKTDAHAIAYGINGAGHFLRAGALKADKPCSTTYIKQEMRVRRLTPLECERLQGFPDNYTNVPGASNTSRYKALGNSIAVNCMELLGERITTVESIKYGGL